MKLVIFDFDGVLVNTILLSFELNKKLNPNLTIEEYSRMSHGNFYELIESENHPFVPNPDYHDEYHKAIRDFDTPEELKNLVKKLSEEFKLAIVSSGSETAITHYLGKDDLLKFFPDIMGFETHKSKTQKLGDLLKKYSLTPVDAVFITDSLGDILEAHKVDIKSIAVTWGLHDRETLEKGKPFALVDTAEQLEQKIKEVLK